MATLIDSYPESNASTALLSFNGSSYMYQGQSFTNTNAINLHSCAFYLKKNGAATGSCYAYIYAHTGTYGSTGLPTGSVLATSDAYDVSTIPTSGTLITFLFTGANQILLNASTYYFVVFAYTGGSGSFNVSFYRDNSSSSHSGNFTYGANIGAMNNINNDGIFYIYGEAGEPVTITASLNSAAYTLAGTTLATKRGFQTEISPAAYTLAGTDLTVKRGLLASVSAFDYDLQGINLTTRLSLSASLSHYAYSLAGIDLDVKRGLLTSLEPSTYTLSGIDLNTKRGFIAALDPSTYTLSGTDLEVIVSTVTIYTVELSPADYTLSGVDLDVKRGYHAGVEPASYSLSGVGVDVKRGYSVALESYGYTLSGLDLTITFGTSILTYTAELSPALYNLTGLDLEVELVLFGHLIILDPNLYDNDISILTSSHNASIAIAINNNGDAVFNLLNENERTGIITIDTQQPDKVM